MRLFLAVELPEDWKAVLDRAAHALAAGGCLGNFTRRENFHLTLAFLGELPGPQDAVRALEQVRVPAFSLESGPPGRFPGKNGDIWWVGVVPAPGLLAAREALAAALDREGLWREDKPFRPHLTLGRQVRPPEGFDAAAWAAGLPRLSCRVDRLTLMQSQYLQGQLTYTPLFRRRLVRPAGRRGRSLWGI